MLQTLQKASEVVALKKTGCTKINTNARSKNGRHDGFYINKTKGGWYAQDTQRTPQCGAIVLKGQVWNKMRDFLSKTEEITVMYSRVSEHRVTTKRGMVHKDPYYSIYDRFFLFFFLFFKGPTH